MAGLAIGGGCCCSPAACHICGSTVTCDGTVITGATVTLDQGGVTLATTTSNGVGSFCFDLDALGLGSGSYRVYVSKAGYYGSNVPVTITCPSMALTGGVLLGTSGIAFDVRGCTNVGLPGALIEIDGGEYYTDASGQVTVPVANGSHPWTISCPGFLNETGTSTTASCSGASILKKLTAATGYFCSPCGFNGNYPMPQVDLTLTDSVYGTFTLFWTGTGWDSGDLTISYPGACGCPAGSFKVRYVMDNSVCASGCGPVIFVHFSGIFCPTSGATLCIDSIGGVTILSLVQTANPFSLTVTYKACSHPAGGGSKLWPGTTATVVITP